MPALNLRRFGFVAMLTGIIALSFTFMASPKAAAEDATVGVSSVKAELGYEAVVEVEALHITAPGLGAWTIDIAYDPDVITPVGCSAALGGICNIAFSADTVRLVGVSTQGVAGDAVLGEIVFECRQVGESALTLEPDVFADATRGAPQPIAAVINHGSFTCSAEPLPTATPEPTAEPPASGPDKLPGDADCNGEVNSIDATYVLQYDALLIDLVPCPDNADMNGDGAINAVDALLILQHVAGF
ncbi:MAG: dockerin type I repeat-containing protein [Chloroflexi bacterium]|nr:dockerin type I repeat-containing protein [Chloroflexota bacterium]